MFRAFDVILSAFGLVIASPVLLFLTVLGLIDTGSPLFLQQRVGKNQNKFILVKFRTMRVGTAVVATHLADASEITTFGKYLRKTKLDELPQLWNVVKGDMSLVGPRPCLPSQAELILERSKLGVFDVRPGVTGLAQIKSIDMSRPLELALLDSEMNKSLNFRLYFAYIFKTLVGKGAGDSINEV